MGPLILQEVFVSDSPSRSSRPSRINILQGLRAYAALPVVLFHTGYTVPGVNKIGIFGVHMFFLLSGYIMAQISALDRHAFMRRRMIRVIPSYWFMTLLLYCVAVFFPRWLNATHAAPSELLKSLFFIPFQKSNGLFQPILFVGWTINYEMYFYVVLGLAILIWPRRPILLASSVLLAITCVCSFFASANAITTFYGDSVVLEFIFGLLAYQIVTAVPEHRRIRAKYLLVGTFVATLVLLPTIEAFGLFSSLPYVVRFGPLSFLLICSSCMLALNGNDLRIGWVVLLGDAGYTLYLVHPYIEMALDRIVARRLPWFHITTTFGCLFAVALAFVISVFLYVRVEKPMLRYLNRKLCGRTRESPQGHGEAQHVATQRATAIPSNSIA